MKQNTLLIIYADSEDSFAANSAYHKALGISQEQIVFCDSQRMTRLECLNSYIGKICVFIDADCFMSQESLRFVTHLAGLDDQSSVCWAGRYMNSPHASLFQKFQNFVANTWLEQSYRPGAEAMLLGGCFIAFLIEPIEPASEYKLFWGGEDKELAARLRSAGVGLRLAEEYSVEHRTRTGWRHFVKRALKHGFYDAGLSKQERDKNFNYQFWIRKIGSVDWRLQPLILLHFCIQRAAKLFRTILPESKK